MTYLTPHANSSGHFKGDLTPLGDRGSTPPAAGGTRATTSSSSRRRATRSTCCWPASATSRPRWAPARRRATSRPRPGSAPSGCCGCGTTRPRTLYYQVGIGTGNAKTVGDHDIWRLPQADDTFGGTDPQYRYIRNRPVFRAAPPGLADQPEPRGPRRRGPRRVLPGVPSVRPGLREPVPDARPSTSSTWPTRRPAADLLTVIPFSFYPESEWRDDLELGATELVLRRRRGRPARRAAAHRPALLPAARPRTGRNAYITGPGDAADTLNLYDVSGLAHYDLYRAIEPGRQPRRARGHAGGAARRHEEAARRRRGAGRDRPVRVRLPVGDLGHDLARRRAVGDGQRVRRS